MGGSYLSKKRLYQLGSYEMWGTDRHHTWIREERENILLILGQRKTAQFEKQLLGTDKGALMKQKNEF